MNLSAISGAVGRELSNHATTILTAGGVVGTVTTATLTARAAFKAARVIDEKQSTQDAELTRNEKFLLVWPQFIPPVAIGSLTVASIVGANYMSGKQAAALAAAYGVSEGRLKELQDKVSEKLTGPKQEAIRSEIAQDRVLKHPPEGQVLILAGSDVLCYDMYTDRYFQSTIEKMRMAQNKINEELFQAQYASLSAFYDYIDLKPTGFSNDVGWNMATTGALELRFETVMSPDEKPCLAMDFVVPPRPEYQQNY